MNIFNVFPTPVGKYNLTRELTEKEKKFIMDAERAPNMGNQTSKENYVLNNKILKGLNNFILESSNDFFQKVYRPRDDVKLRLTQSWFNYTEPGQFHHKHAHPNSFLSGVFYVNADPQKDKIYFYREGYQQIKLSPVEWNTYNSESWWFEAGTCVMYIFPSSLTHMVEIVTAAETRVSIAFNTFLQGVIGDNHSLTELKVEK